MDQEEAVELLELVKAGRGLPTRMEDLVKVRVAAEIMVNFHRDILKRIKTGELILAEDDRKTKLGDGQSIGIMLLDAEAKIGELLRDEIPDEGARGSKVANKERALDRGTLGAIPRKRREMARTIHRNPAAVAAIIEEARENEDIPTKTAVLNRIRYDKEKERQTKAGKRKIPDLILTLEQERYINALYGVLNILPTAPPKNWNEKAFAHAQSLIRTISKRLEVFNGKTEKYLA